MNPRILAMLLLPVSIIAGCQSQGSILLDQAAEAIRGKDYDRALFNAQEYLKRYPSKPDTAKASAIRREAGEAKREVAANEIESDLKSMQLDDARQHLDDVRELEFLPGNEIVVMNLDSLMRSIEDRMRRFEEENARRQRHIDSIIAQAGTFPRSAPQSVVPVMPEIPNLDSLIEAAVRMAPAAPTPPAVK